VSLADRLEDVELDLDEDETVLDRVFLEVDVWRVIVFAFILIIGTSSLVSMVTFLYVFEEELVMTGGYRPIYDLAQLGLFAACGCIFFAMSAMIYRAQNDVSLAVGAESTEGDD